MPNLTNNFSFNQPLVNNATDADLWGGQLNDNWGDIDGYLSLNTEVKSSDFSVISTEFNYTYLIDASSNTVTATLPAASSVFDGFTVRFKTTDVTNTVTIDGNGSETIDGQATFTIDAANQTLEIVCDGSNWLISSFSPEQGTADQVLTSNGSGGTPSFQTPIFSKSYVSGEQTISGGGTVSLSHGLGEVPKLIQLRIICKTAEQGYSVNDELIINNSASDANFTQNSGVSCVVGTSTISIKYGSVANVFLILNKTTGTATGITPGNWRLVAYAWA